MATAARGRAAPSVAPKISCMVLSIPSSDRPEAGFLGSLAASVLPPAASPRCFATDRESRGRALGINEASLYRHVKSFVTYYHESRTHLSLVKDSPESRAVQPPELGQIVAIPQVGGLHHRYERRAA